MYTRYSSGLGVVSIVDAPENAQTLAIMAAGQSAKNTQLMTVGIPTLLVGGYLVSQGKTGTALLVVGGVAAAYVFWQFKNTAGLF